MSLQQVPPIAAETVPSLRTGLRAPVIAIYLVILCGILAITVWAATAPLSEGAAMSGRVAVESNRQVVQHLEGGIVEAILVRDGSVVAAGDVLIRLSGVRALSQLQGLQERLYAVMARRARLLAERDEAAEIDFPTRLLVAAKEPVIADQVRTQQLSFASRRATRDGQVAILNQRLDQLSRQRDGLNAQLSSAETQLAKIEEELAGLRRLYAQGLAPKTRLLALERAGADLTGRRGQLVAEIARNDVAAGETRLQIDQVMNTFAAGVMSDLEQVEQDLATLETQITAAQDQMTRTEIRAPVAGVVTNLAIHTVDAVIAPGAPLLDIVPQDQPLVIEAMVPPVDIDKVRPGEETEVRFSAFSLRKTPSVFGTVQRVSADLVNAGPDVPAYYLARVSVSSEEMTRLGGLEIVPGMPVEVIVNTGERTVLDYFVRPLVDMFARSLKEE
ncbi:HlyD family type I secretion periplasmic adaptor subunit [Zavarzinia compransoris]|uniref:HlyD family type I secretion periplasmic adaptor subunit n=1 Tax=Zavarzinia marina TaxID=2911065 RepID=UPI001F393712|nr:HlyD family type I secretion periplasmic adaptor subunit [Zavarzinia marina]MCF4164735.1 HlyD family type I secretion periplasmic adaptor subunit [Zavarzinia marina]